MEIERARKLGEDLIERLRPTCARIEIAGSIRRGKPEVKDIEIVAMPILKPPLPRFGDKAVFKTPLDKLIAAMLVDGVVAAKNGAKYKQIEIMDGNMLVIKVDLFLVTPPAQWGVIQVIRTGPAEFSQWMVTPKSKGGALTNGYHVEGGCVVHDMQADYRISMPEEINFFAFCGLEWVEPRERREYWVWPGRP
jgi:DNA polymerase/3'-5' exonuclease PolX